MEQTHRVIKVGNCSTGNSEGGVVYSPIGVSQTITAGGHGYSTGNILVLGSAQRNCFIGDGTIYPTLTEAMGMGGGQTPMIVNAEDDDGLPMLEIRKNRVRQANSQAI